MKTQKQMKELREQFSKEHSQLLIKYAKRGLWLQVTIQEMDLDKMTYSKSSTHQRGKNEKAN